MTEASEDKPVKPNLAVSVTPQPRIVRDRDPRRPGSTLQELETLPLQTRIDEAIRLATEVYEGLGTHRDNIFKDASAQAATIFCSVHRLERLSQGKPADFHRSDVDVFLTLLSSVIERQDFIHINRSSVGSWGGWEQYRADFTIPLAEPYQSDTIDIVHYSRNSDNALRNVVFDMEPNKSCSIEFLAPVPNSREARHFESLSVAAVLARSLRRLNGFKERLQTIEDGASKANSLRIVLGRLKKDLEFDAADPAVAREKMREYELELKRAVSIMRKTPSDIKENYSVTKDEVNQILKLFKGSA